MKSKTRIVTVLAILICGWAWAGTENTNQPAEQVRLDIDLVDGSRIIGTPTMTSVPIETPYAKVDVPLGKISTIEIGEDHQTASIVLRNGDNLSGVVSLEPFVLDTLFGSVRIDITSIKHARVLLSEGNLSNALLRGLIWRYPFSANAHDASGRGNRGTVYGAILSHDRFGRPQKAYAFDGTSSYIEFPPNPDLAFSADFTLAAWVFSTRNSGWQGVVSYDLSGTHGYGLCLRSDGVPGAWIGNGATWDYAHGSTSIRGNGKWHHLAAVRRAGILYFYLDGVEQNVTTAHPVAYYGNQARNPSRESRAKVVIGKHTHPDQYFGGSINNVLFYNRALSRTEIHDLARAELQ